MIKYELRCKKCGKSLGYITQYDTNGSSEIINSASIYGLRYEVLCPECMHNCDEKKGGAE